MRSGPVVLQHEEWSSRVRSGPVVLQHEEWSSSITA